MAVSDFLRARPACHRMRLSNSLAPGTVPLLFLSNFGPDSCSGMRSMRFPLSERQLAHHDSVDHQHNVPDCPQESRPAPAVPVPTRQRARLKSTGRPWPSKWPPSFWFSMDSFHRRIQPTNSGRLVANPETTLIRILQQPLKCPADCLRRARNAPPLPPPNCG